MIILDSGLGGISVVRALKATRPDLPLIYCADVAGFPYGKRSIDDITTRAIRMVEKLEKLYPNSPMVIACNTLSTLCLETLRQKFSVPFVGTVPAIKTAVSHSKTKRFTLLATPNTAQSRYSETLITQFADDCVVDRYGAPNLAALAEQALLGERISPEQIRTEIAPAFHDDVRGKTDTIVLGCTHYPLMIEALRLAAPWPVAWIDSSEAIARRALSFPDSAPDSCAAYITCEQSIPRYRPVFAREGFAALHALSV